MLKGAKALLWAVLGVGIALALVAGGIVLWSTYNKSPLPIADRCVATAGGRSTTIDLEQARYASIIAGMSIKRGLEPRAASIALATAYQESGIRNLDYGHADSLGLFQQRPSKGWGTVEEIMDPWYSTREFYRAMDRVKGWQTKDLNDVAQAVQRSAYPEAYRRHVPNARTLASSLTGETPASFSCSVYQPHAGDPEGLVSFLTKTLGKNTISISREDSGLRIKATTTEVAWAVAHLAIANTSEYGVASVKVGAHSWTHNGLILAEWEGSGPADATEVSVMLSGPTPR